MHGNTYTQLGHWSALIAFTATVLFGIAQVLQVAGVLHAPLDGIFIYTTSLCIPLPFMLAMLALHYAVPEDKKIWTQGALLFTALYTAFVTLNYTVQLGTVIPATLNGTYHEVRLLDQTPHSLFWDIDAIGYICMGFATFMAAFAIKNSGIGTWTKRFFIAHGIMNPVIALVYFYPHFSYTLLILATPWLITAVGSMLLLAVWFKRQYKFGAATTN